MVDGDKSPIDPGSELAWIRIGVGGVEFEFEALTLDIWVDFQIFGGGKLLTQIDIENKRGDLELLWRLLGHSVEESNWPTTTQPLTVQFTGNYQLIVPLDDRPMGCIRGVLPGDGVTPVYDEF